MTDKLMRRDAVIAQLDRARTALAEAKTIQQTKRILDVAHASEILARRQKLGDEAIAYAHAIKVEALTQLGRLLKEMPKNVGTRGQLISRGVISGSRDEPLITTPTLAELGIDKKTSMVAQQLAALPEETRKAIAEQETTVTNAVRLARRDEVREAAQLPTDKYRVLYCDPPWQYSDKLTENYGGSHYHYPSMSLDELCDLPVEELAVADAVLFLWVTSPMLEVCFRVIRAWGFKYKASFVWDKVKHNMGHYNSVRHEFLLICTRGSCVPDVPKLFDSVQSIERSTKHSEKPAQFRRIIETLYPHGKRVELFAREQHKGWDVWGNQYATDENS